MPFYQSGDLRLHYVARNHSPHPRPTLVFQHGIGGDVWQPGRFLAPERMGISADALRIVHADFRAHGESDAGDVEQLSIESLARDLGALLDHLDVRRAIVGGISMGAAAFLRLAVDRPGSCDALILSRPAWADEAMSAVARHALALLADLLAADDWKSSALPALEASEVLEAVESICPDAAKSLRGHVQGVLARPDTRAAAVARLRHLPESRGLNDLRDLATVRCPTLILAAQDDPIHPFECARRLALALPNSRLVEIAPKSPVDG